MNNEIIIEDIKKGDKFYFYNDGYKYHVVANLPEDEIIIIKYFGKHKQWWHFEIKTYYNLKLMLEYKKIEVAK